MIRIISAVFLAGWLVGAMAFTLRAAHPLPGQVVTDNAMPFTTIRIYLDNLDVPFWRAQLGGNLLLMLPLGLFGPLALPFLARWWRVVLLAFVLSTAIELAQLRIPDRSADVDDVMLNVVGALLGYWLLLVLRLRPDAGPPARRAD